MLNRVLAATALCLALSAQTTVAQDLSSQRRFNENGRSIEVDILGRVEFTDDSRAIESQAPGSRFTMTETGPGVPTRRIELNASEAGTVERRYQVNGAPAAFDAAAQSWFENTLREVIRRTSSTSVTGTSTSTSRSESSRSPGGSSSSSSSATAEPPF